MQSPDIICFLVIDKKPSYVFATLVMYVTKIIDANFHVPFRSVHIKLALVVKGVSEKKMIKRYVTIHVNSPGAGVHTPWGPNVFIT